ncbi:MAG: nitrogen fixation transcript antitermination sensor histidine kinase [Deltaproteobacteria bacterium]|nr:nitrogen fixation transcript antitermination sensor histidine kinase [Deltaproteobacteria bacterium]
MDHFKIDQKLLESIMADLKGKGCTLSFEEVTRVVDLITEEVIYRYVDHLISQVETIMEINPHLTEKEILETVAKNVVEYLGAEAASLRIFDPGKEEMISFGSYPPQTEAREEAIPFEDTIAGEVVKTHRAYFVPNILKEEKYKNKEKVQKYGIYSMLAVPILIPRFSLKDVDTEGSFQIYYKEMDKIFTHVVLEAGYPEVQHGIGKAFSVKDEPYIEVVVNQGGPFGEFENEKIFPSYILIHNPQESWLLPSDLKRFLEIQQIHSVLYIPLKVNDVVNYFIAFDAQAHHRRFSDEELEIFIFFGKELMKGLRMEKMDDILHDFKNPAIAAAGFAKRIQKILEDGEYPSKKEKVVQALDIILKETSRIQELALTLHGEGREEMVDLTEKLSRRFTINQEAIKELKRENVHLIEGDLESSLGIRCFPLHIERVLDNLLNNASNALPEEGGHLSIRSYRKEGWAVAEITNTGQISEEDKKRYLHGEGKGRGLHITSRLVKLMGGKTEVESGEGQTTFRVMFPLAK